MQCMRRTYAKNSFGLKMYTLKKLRFVHYKYYLIANGYHTNHFTLHTSAATSFRQQTIYIRSCRRHCSCRRHLRRHPRSFYLVIFSVKSKSKYVSFVFVLFLMFIFTLYVFISIISMFLRML